MKPERDEQRAADGDMTEEGAADRQDERRLRLQGAVDRLARRAARWEPGRIQLMVGAVALPLGLAIIIIGWYGAAHTFRTYQQLPYLISGGMLGLGVVIFGATAVAGYWAANILRLLTEVRSELRGGAAGAPAAGEAAPARSPRLSLVVTPGGTQYHEPDCRVVAGRTDVRPVSPEEALRYSPCRLCDPELGVEQPPSPARASARKGLMKAVV